MGTSVTRNSAPLGPYGRTMPRALWRPSGGGLFLMSKVALSLDTHTPALPLKHGTPPHSRCAMYHRAVPLFSESGTYMTVKARLWEHLLKFHELSSETQGNLASTVFYVPYSLDSWKGDTNIPRSTIPSEGTPPRSSPYLLSSQAKRQYLETF